MKSILIQCLFWLKYLTQRTTFFTNSSKSTEHILISFSVSVLPQSEKKMYIITYGMPLVFHPFTYRVQ